MFFISKIMVPLYSPGFLLYLVEFAIVLVTYLKHLLRGTGSIEWNEKNKNLYPIACVLTVLNSSINFVVYSVFNQKFRTVLASIFWTKAHSNNESTEKGTVRLDLRRAK